MKFENIQQAVDAIGKRVTIDGTDLTALVTAILVRETHIQFEVSWIKDGHIMHEYLGQSRIEPASGTGLSTHQWLALKVSA